MFRATDKKIYFAPIKKLGAKTYQISFDYEPVIDEIDGQKVESEIATWTEEIITHKPTDAEIQRIITEEIDSRTKDSIVNGFYYTLMENEEEVHYNVHLSVENQTNYKAAYDRAVQTNGENLPYTIKAQGLGDTKYLEFHTVEEFKKFYDAMNDHITATQKAGWAKKDAINWEDYKID